MAQSQQPRIAAQEMLNQQQREIADLNAEVERLRQLNLSVAEEERQRIARDLHDSVSQILWSAKLAAEALPLQFGQDQARGMIALEHLRGLIDGALSEMRMLLLELRPTAMRDMPLDDLLQRMANSLRFRTGIPVQLEIRAQRLPLPFETQFHVYQIVQEALSNVIKHAEARSAKITLNWLPHGFSLAVYDDGCGFDRAQVRGDSMGLTIIRERAREIGARQRITSQPGQGTIITLLWTAAQQAAVEEAVDAPGRLEERDNRVGS